MKVNLVSSSTEKLRVAFTAIRTCYSKHSPTYLWEEEFYKYVERNDDHLRLIKQIQEHGHTSTLEHIQYTFTIEGMSRNAHTQLVRHRHASYSVQSQRYVKFKNGFSYFIPPKILENKIALYHYKWLMKQVSKVYDILIKVGVPAEDARYVLPGSAMTNLTFSINLRALLEFYSKRNHTTHAQWEIQQFAEILRELVEEDEPAFKMLFTIPYKVIEEYEESLKEEN